MRQLAYMYANTVTHYSIRLAFAHPPLDRHTPPHDRRKYFKAHPDQKQHILGTSFHWKDFFALMDTDGRIITSFTLYISLRTCCRIPCL